MSNLQLFAEPEGGDGNGADGGNGDGSGTEPGGSTTEPMSFDDFLRTGENRAEFDRRVQKAVNTAVANAQEKWQALTDDKLSEAEKLAKMTKEEKTKYLADKRDRELTEREQAITRRELEAEAKNTLAGKKLPIELADILDYTDADKCNESIEKVEKVFQSAVEAAVQERLKGGDPMKKEPGDNTTEEERLLKIALGEM